MRLRRAAMVAVATACALAGRAAATDAAPPAAPEGVEASTVGPGAIALRWQPADPAAVVRWEVRRDDALAALVTAPEARDEDLAPGTLYCYRVIAHDAAGNASDPSLSACARTPPATPGALTARALGETEALLSWSPPAEESGVASYELVRDGRVVAGTPSLAAAERKLRAFTTYCWTVRALDADGQRSPPSPPTCLKTPDLTPPTAPERLAVQASSDRSVELTWAAASDAGGIARYEILRDGEPVLESAAPGAVVTGLHPGDHHCWAVRARDAAGNASAPSQPACAATPDLTPPTRPERVAVAVLSSSAVEVTWDPAQDDVGVVGYELVREGAPPQAVAGTGAEATGLAAGTRYCFSVRALDAAGHRSEPSELACAATGAAGAPGAPRRLRAEASSPRAVRLTWEPSLQPGVVYRVYWDDGRGIGSTRQTTFTAAGLRPGERHCYRVAAVDEEGRESPRTLDACASSDRAAPRPAEQSAAGAAPRSAGPHPVASATDLHTRDGDR